MQPLLRLAAAIDRLNELIARSVAWLTVAMVFVGAYNALVRKLRPEFSSNTYLELQWYLFSLVFLLSAAHALKTGGHVRVDLWYSRLSARGQAAINVAGTVLFLLPFTVCILWVSAPRVYDSWAIAEQSPNPGGLPVYPILTVILIAFAQLLLQGVSELVKSVALLLGHDEIKQ